MKGIILAGGRGTRLFPATLGISKQLLPIAGKPMIYFPLTTLMMAGIREILIITTPEDQEAYRRVLGNGHQWGIYLEYAIQTEPRGLADAFLVGKKFLGGQSACLILGDNLFYGHDFQDVIRDAAAEAKRSGAVIFGYPVRDPERYGVVELDQQGRPIALEEKPKAPKSRLAIPGLYFYDERVTDIAASLTPSPRGELEITDLNRCYLAFGRLSVKLLGRGTAWLDAGTHESLLQASNFIHAIEERQGLMVACPEEVAYRKQFITKEMLAVQAARYPNSYGDYLKLLIEESL